MSEPKLKASPLTNATLISQGAEARLYTTTFLNRKTIVKERFPKKYRHPQLDQKITQSRVVGVCGIM